MNYIPWDISFESPLILGTHQDENNLNTQSQRMYLHALIMNTQCVHTFSVIVY